jgi:hypothetical protein
MLILFSIDGNKTTAKYYFITTTLKKTCLFFFKCEKNNKNVSSLKIIVLACFGIVFYVIYLDQYFN